MDAELPDFEPSDGHRHDCPRRDAPAFAAALQRNLTACDCAAELYALAARAEEAIHLKLENLGPMDGRHVLVARGKISTSPGSFGEDLLKELVRMATARGLEGPAAPHVPLVIVLPDEGQKLELLDEKDMESHGWFRAGVTIKREGSMVHLPPGAYS